MAAKNSKYNLITILGPTATGKTGIAANLAAYLKGEIISADSRQVYRGMDLGTGKDYEDYFVDGIEIPSHLVDIEDAGVHYNVYRFQTDFIKVFDEIQSRNKFPILCGGSGLYLEAILKNYRLIEVPPNKVLRKELEGKNLNELTEILKNLKPKLHNHTDVETDRRAVRAIEIEKYYAENPKTDTSFPEINSLNIGIDFDRKLRRERITKRLKQRLEDGMLDEVRKLLDSGLTPGQLIYYGLEYKFLTLHLTGELSFDEMFAKLEIAIHQFAKRQMTWFRGMEKRGTKIHWIDGQMEMEEKVGQIVELLKCRD
ncbi:MAG: tRNA (adenosine(37)-N6)-dimethylallyltransferase MiaA [Prolixibacteraceae bacterium]|jgi:tRNA dimethylallyltransferase|nr:tRNA (adenosine(37)-N6)-dimethylallyltransferase MiaA [Prolixibacteraceae bacterium]MBT6004886.1 tRNA (adenosine(37)-N6)-dimethylallyltransferase MiaA [Prolixibacteraceae bacterium]MBT6767147.1 tRNA (adenosine(37)-N6)-dimethylallyltransferase MiaA [Prolixibacteraceae bacterium]MBT6999732.1 tRNA (adenosine(37)-N6)-dimethylallyltransferase MiaA [Prolixibacteraceae bacterium]MBT7394688.1 tRNA (adenosine(37)-N6)-dimethylallyltransferase MiaA [Prolixibacteraceae bacterium]